MLLKHSAFVSALGLLLALSACPPRSAGGAVGSIEQLEDKDALLADGVLKAVRKTVHVPGRYETRTKSVPKTQYKTEYQQQCSYSYSSTVGGSQRTCRSVPVGRTVTTYETQTERVWVPPRTYVTTVYRKRAVLLEGEVEIKARPRFPKRKVPATTSPRERARATSSADRREERR